MIKMDVLFAQAFPVKCTTINCPGTCITGRKGYCSNYNYYNLAVNKLGQNDLHLYWMVENAANPFLLRPTSQKEHFFCCPRCKNVWQMTVAKFTSGKRCPKCKSSSVSGTLMKSKRFKTSKKEKLVIARYEKILNEPAKSMLNNCQFFIPTVGKVDGYFPRSNTVVEFHGCYWHGCPRCFAPNERHPKLKVLYSSLYQKTMIRDAKISALGFNLITVWEHDI